MAVYGACPTAGAPAEETKPTATAISSASDDWSATIKDDDEQGDEASADASSSLKQSLLPTHHQQHQHQQHRHPDTIRERVMALGEVAYAYDLTLAQLIYQRCGQSRGARIAWEVLCQSCDGILWFLMVLPVIGIMWLLGMLQHVSPASSAMFKAFYTCNIVDLAGIVVMKLLFKRHRPPHHVTDSRFVGPDVHSFPSGHATRAFCIVGLIMELGAHHEWILTDFFHLPAFACQVLILTWAFLVAFARMALGRHYPSDVAAGVLIGFFLFYPMAHFVILHFHMFDPIAIDLPTNAPPTA